MLPELSLLPRGSTASTDAPRARPIPSGAEIERSLVHDGGSLARAPRWSMLALHREMALQVRQGPPPEPKHGLGRRVLAPISVGAATVVGLVALGGFLVAMGIVAAVAMTLAVVTRLQVIRRWSERQRLAHLDQEALRLKGRLVAKLHREHREELECLMALVENVRDHEGLRADAGRGASTLVARLDALLLSYVERAIEVRGVAAAFAVTVADEPKLPEPTQVTDGTDRISEAERRRAFQILHLRTRAREMCRRRIERMERELVSIGQLVRLVHEQALASGLGHDELAGLLADVLDEAEHARQAREEVEAALESGHTLSDLHRVVSAVAHSA
jgi:hypothetical protein